ncbi:ExbD/TolR family protein [Longimicrobium sp.]|uniref:ExbD/TolR family protein n=1 Tax=Longimicrobium sp. TaxID=2029185 RepID=UPI002E32AE79|nr:biopolymer transporter ExbD [Longimicrobium sp.]HEX6041277.1 biopolymer transporter ExbD [Longimicrobium sp.]
MPVRTRPPDVGLSTEINVTPMIDVMLVLLIIFMVTSATIPFTATLPRAREAAPAPEDRVTLGIDDAGRYWIADVPQPGPIHPDALAARLQAAYTARGVPGDNTLYLKAHDGASYATVLRAMDSARQVGVRHVAMITDAARD